MIATVQRLTDNYWVWLKAETTLQEVNGWVEITTPFLDRVNDHVQLYARLEGESITLTDDGYTIQELATAGCDLTKRRRMLLEQVLNGFGVQLDENRLVVRASRANFPQKKHNLIQAVLAAGDLFYTASATVENLFFEDVQDWLTSTDIRFTPRVKFSGRSGYDHSFDFVIPASRKAPERLVQAVNHPDKGRAQATTFSWLDTREVRSPDSRLYVILNDTDRPPGAEVLDAMRNYDIHPMLWRSRELSASELRA